VIRDAVTCDRDGCVALFLEPVDDPYALDTDEFEDVMKRAGWTYGNDGHRCPGCVRGTGPVLEPGGVPALHRDHGRPPGGGDVPLLRARRAPPEGGVVILRAIRRRRERLAAARQAHHLQAQVQQATDMAITAAVRARLSEPVTDIHVTWPLRVTPAGPTS
jgi:hypothetical protein